MSRQQVKEIDRLIELYGHRDNYHLLSDDLRRFLLDEGVAEQANGYCPKRTQNVLSIEDIIVEDDTVQLHLSDVRYYGSQQQFVRKHMKKQNELYDVVLQHEWGFEDLSTPEKGIFTAQFSKTDSNKTYQIRIKYRVEMD
ncbi:hypothetical protein JXB41_07990 [Candidatus Woesearchaeota archaeon]|nr:hypothetical protein [Candidatus Woesearchaeota archaeon]